MKEPKVSIIVPVYNVEKYVRQCVESLMGQTLEEIEIICMNDGSRDASPEILRQLQQEDSRIKIVDKENSGYGDTVNIGIDLARGKYIGILESDDFAAPNMYELLYHKAVRMNADLVKGNYYNYFTEGDKSILEEYLRSFPYDSVLSDIDRMKTALKDPAIWCGLYKKSLLENNNIRLLSTPGASYQDISFTYKAALCANAMVLIKEPLLYYRRDNENSSVKDDGKAFCVCNEMEEILRFSVENGYTETLPLYAKEMYYRYKWNLERLSIKKRPKFLLIMYQQLREASFSGLLQKEYWSDTEWEAVHKLIFNFPEVYEAVIEGQELIDRRKSDREAILEALAHSHPLLIYGAGQRGKRLLAALQRYQIVPDGIVVTNFAGNPGMIEGVPVIDVQYVASHLRDALILLGVADRLKAEVLDVLTQYHLNGNHLLVRNEMLNMLETDEVLG